MIKCSHMTVKKGAYLDGQFYNRSRGGPGLPETLSRGYAVFNWYTLCDRIKVVQIFICFKLV